MKKRLSALLLALTLLLCTGCTTTKTPEPTQTTAVETIEPAVTEDPNMGEWA